MKILKIEELEKGMQVLTECKDGFEIHIVEDFDEDNFTFIDQHGLNIYPYDEHNEAFFIVCEYNHGK